MNLHKIIILIALLFNFFNWAQELPPLQNFSPVDYNAETQNWSISQAPDKIIYIANNKGLLEYNGAAWKLYPSPNETIMRSVKVVGDKIYTGCYMEFGYWQKNKFGILKYTSLSQKLNTDLIEDEEFWNIIVIDDWLVFQSLNRIYIINSANGSLKVIDSNNTITKMFKVDQSIYFQRINEGIYKIENGIDILVFNDKIIKENEVINIFKTENDFLILTQNKGFYILKNGEFVQWDINSKDYLSRVSVYSGIQCKDKSFVLGTIANGLIYLNKKGDIQYEFDQSRGLLNNTILSLFEDKDENIWLGLDNGVTYINLNSPFKIYRDKKGILGSIYTSAVHNGNLFLGTNQGLFYKPLGDKYNEFEFVEGTQGQVWFLDVLDQQLFCGHNSGTFIIRKNKAERISDISGTWSIIRINDKPNLLMQGSYDGLYILEKLNNKWQLRNRISGFNNSSRNFEIIDNRILVNHEYKGIFNVVVDSTFSKTNEVTLDTILKGANSAIINYKGDILYASKKGIFKYKKEERKFIKDSILSDIFNEDEYVSGNMIFHDIDDKLWLFTKSNLIFVTQGNLSSVPNTNIIPITKEERNDVIEYENIIELHQDNYLIGSNSGYLLLNSRNFEIKDFDVSISNVFKTSHNKDGIIKYAIDVNNDTSFESNENNFEFFFFTPEYNKFMKPNFQFRLEGIYDNWSNWSTESNVLFENLPHGSYTFYVRAKIGDKNSTNTASYSFSIARPWYISNLMITLYGLLVILSLVFIHKFYNRYYLKKEQNLLEENRKELELAKLQNEQEIIKLKHEQLKNDIQNKSKELAASIMSVVKKNELLIEIKNQLTKVENKDSITPVLKIIDKSLRRSDNWKLFKEAFDNVDREFLKKLKSTHPNLSPNDIKLCAYLRLNLSSKEIAPLFNISAKSVEIKRYRLRKKMNLSHDDNLVNYILEL